MHNDGIVNRKYLQKANVAVSVDGKDAVIEGARLNVTEEYFNKASSEVLFAGIVLLQNCWRKWIKQDISAADTALENIMLELTSKKEYGILQRLGCYTQQIKTHDAKNRYVFDFIYFLSLKRQGNKPELEAHLAKIDKSTLRPRLLVALSALSDDREGFYKNLKKAVAIGDLEKSDFTDSSLVHILNEFKEDKDFTQKIDQIFQNK